MKRALTALLLAAGLALASATPARAQTYAEVEWFDRDRRDCDGFADAAVDCSYRWRLLLHLEQPPFEAAPWFRMLARIEILSRRDGEEDGHFNPVKSDLGGGAVLAYGPWSLTLLLSSEHCADVVCVSEPYNSITVRWQP
jgi:hypothetical protein